ncbi:DUF2484 family protein [Rubellimicrobium aerolatum]|uniref:DUF2484 family protein n=1 Tax=Rubellimicrobium aerolatum TaxID=490979 RepID=A0ABW0S6P7_9RHOB|nr:DUF2484 family protein [Rubellimicrobium aerolatum]MBP1804610.1 hypothetical protein [Rubellimicrobium aerolatum]
MSLALLLAGMWVVMANCAALLPTRQGQWMADALLVAVGVPLLGWVTLEHGPVTGVATLAVGAAVLRWPVLPLLRRARPPQRNPAE